MNDDRGGVERICCSGEEVDKLQRLADALEGVSSLRIQVVGDRIDVPVPAEFSIEHERGEDEEEVEFQLKWSLDEDESADDDEPIV